jgi:hypothetical protein
MVDNVHRVAGAAIATSSIRAPERKGCQTRLTQRKRRHGASVAVVTLNGDVAPQMPRCKLSKAGDEVAPEVPACEPHDQVHQAGQDEEPGCQEVEATPPAILVEDVVCARGTDDGTVAREKT